MKKYVFSFLFAALVVFWIIPWVGHQVLVSDDCYTLKRSSLYITKKNNCFEFKREKINGRFLFIYEYNAIISKFCEKNIKTNQYDEVFILIKVEKPHTIIADIFSLNPPEFDMIPLEIIYSEKRKLND